MDADEVFDKVFHDFIFISVEEQDRENTDLNIVIKNYHTYTNLTK